MKKKKYITIAVPEKNHTEIKTAASLLGISIKEFIIRSFKTYGLKTFSEEEKNNRRHI